MLTWFACCTFIVSLQGSPQAASPPPEILTFSGRAIAAAGKTPVRYLALTPLDGAGAPVYIPVESDGKFRVERNLAIKAIKYRLGVHPLEAGEGLRIELENLNLEVWIYDPARPAEKLGAAPGLQQGGGRGWHIDITWRAPSVHIVAGGGRAKAPGGVQVFAPQGRELIFEVRPASKPAASGGRP